MARPLKVLPPPPSWKASGALPDLLCADDLAALPQNPKRRYRIGVDLVVAATNLNEAFSWYASWAVGQHARASPGETRRWFLQVAGLATDLMQALGHIHRDRPGPGFQDVLLHLMPTKPNPGSITGGPERERQAKHMLEFLVRRAAPDMYAVAERDRADDPAWEVTNDVLGERLQSMLALLRLLADRGADYNAPLVRHGGREREEARKHLFAGLAGIYRELFGRLPPAPSGRTTRAEEEAGERRRTLPKGIALDWFRALVALVGERAAAVSSTAGAPNADRTKLALVVVKLAADAARGEAQDGLGHWIRDGAAAHKKPRPQAPELDDPDLALTPLKELFG